MSVNSLDYGKEKAKRKFKFKEEKAALERILPELIRLINTTNYILAIIAMVLIGIFIKLVIMTW